MSLFDDYVQWVTPDGTMTLRLAYEYEGMRKQQRTCLVDTMGRVYHYDSAEIYQRASEQPRS